MSRSLSDPSGGPDAAPVTDYFGLAVPFMQFLGLIPEHLELDYCRTRLPALPHLTNSRGELHGGTLMSVLDFTLTAAARSHAPTRYGVATIEMSSHFLDSAHGDVIIEATCLRRGRTIAFCDGTVTDGVSGKRLVVARASLKLLERRPAPEVMSR